MGAIVIRTRYDEGTESAEVATSAAERNLQNDKISTADQKHARIQDFKLGGGGALKKIVPRRVARKCVGYFV